MIDDKGRCCGRKPIAYKGQGRHKSGRKRFCARCDKAYDYDTYAPIENWAWSVINGVHVRKEEGK